MSTAQQEIIQPVDPSLLEAELTSERLLRHTNKGGNLIYVVDAHNAPNVMREIGRLREIAFRAAGGGTGTACDIDEYDTMTPPCRQLLVWDPSTRQILGGYRYIRGLEVAVLPDDTPRIATGHMFRFSDRFMRDYMPHTLELGRSWVRLECQSTRAGSKAIYALDNLWDGLGALTVKYPEIRYLFGKVTMYPSYPRRSRDLLLYFLSKHFPDPDRLVTPIRAVERVTPDEELQATLCGTTFAEDYHIMKELIRAAGYNIPPLVNAYMSLSPTMRMFGTAVNDLFGNVEETGILLTVDEILEEKKLRHIATYHP